MTENSLPDEELPDLLPDEPGYLRESGQAVGEDGSVVPIIGGLPAVEGSSWDIGAPVEDRGAGLAEEQATPRGRAGHEDTGSI